MKRFVGFCMNMHSPILIQRKSGVFSVKKKNKTQPSSITENTRKPTVFEYKETALQCLLDTIMMLTFFDAVVIAIATCSYRDSNMMLST